MCSSCAARTRHVDAPFDVRTCQYVPSRPATVVRTCIRHGYFPGVRALRSIAHCMQDMHASTDTRSRRPQQLASIVRVAAYYVSALQRGGMHAAGPEGERDVYPADTSTRLHRRRRSIPLPFAHEWYLYVPAAWPHHLLHVFTVEILMRPINAVGVSIYTVYLYWSIYSRYNWKCTRRALKNACMHTAPSHKQRAMMRSLICECP